MTVASFFLADMVAALPARMSHTQQWCLTYFHIRTGETGGSCSLGVDASADASADVMDTNCFKLKRDDVEIEDVAVCPLHIDGNLDPDMVDTACFKRYVKM
ncbi:hypothetical protein IQ07DRAFT_635607 [Pyrenochaeta sp. DS3sAY3a]|nr:hypothetical protein IQ07DRAFT_635607 [Pyrenochaeta sp. DS3sAY3a]